MKNLFLKKKTCSILLLLKDSEQPWYPSKLARSSGSSYVHTVNSLSSLRAFGVVISEKKGKQNMIRLTEKGAYLAQSLDDFSKKCDSYEHEAKKPQEPLSVPQPASTPLASKPTDKSPQPEKK
jgi:predicted transcriptional regulator